MGAVVLCAVLLAPAPAGASEAAGTGEPEPAPGASAPHPAAGASAGVPSGRPFDAPAAPTPRTGPPTAPSAPSASSAPGVPSEPARIWSLVRGALPARVAEALPETPAELWRQANEGRGLAAAIGALLVVLLLDFLRRLIRGRGDLAVTIDVPAEWRPSFSVRLRRRRERRVPGRTDDFAPVPEARASSRFEQNLIAREAHFRSIPARTYWVVLDGAVEAGDHEPPRAVYEEREVCVRRGRTLRVDFDLRPRSCVLEIRILREGRPASDARVATGGDPTSLRFAGGGVARLSLPKGRHTILVGAGDRAAERSLAIDTLGTQELEVDLDVREELAFDGCPEAVDPFLRGDLSVVAAALEKAGQSDRAHLVAARFHAERGNLREAVHHYVETGRLAEAAELLAQAQDHAAAAGLFERAGLLQRAAELYDAAGDGIGAGRTFEALGDLEAATLRYRSAGATPELLAVLEKADQHFEAGELALAEGDTTRAIRNFQHVGPKDAGHRRACQVLAEHFAGEGKPELALQKAEEALSFSRPEERAVETTLWYAALFDRLGRPDRALALVLELRERAPETEGIATRVEELRKKVSAAERRGPASSGAFAFAPDRYQVIEEIGAGGMGIVYRARDQRLGRDVALKRLPDNLKENPRAVELFLREARAAARLNHPNVVTVHDVDQIDGHYFITMELLVGTNLVEVLKGRGRIAARDAVKIGLQVAAGLTYAHGEGVVHRDVKTANLFFTQDRTVKIMDFGLAKMMAEVRRASTVVGGTPYYMAPEQAAGESVDHRADLYAFGATLYELLTGRPPFTEGDVAYHHRHTPVPDPRGRAAGIPDGLAELVLALLAKDPASRPKSAEGVGRSLRDLL